MITLNQFVKKWDGKQVEVHGSSNALYQCVDLCNAYLRDVWNLPIVKWTNAVDFPEKINCEFIKNTLEGVPQPGDVIVFKKYGSLYGTAGHIGIVTEATVNLVRIFEQNYPTGSACKIGSHNYLGCRGWLRKVNMNPDWLIQNSDSWIGTLAYLEIQKDNPILDDVKNVVAGIKARAVDMEKQKGQLEAEVIGLKETLSTKDTDLLKAEKDLKDCNSKLSESEKNLVEAKGQITGMIAEKQELGEALAECQAKKDYSILIRPSFRKKKSKYFIAKYKL